MGSDDNVVLFPKARDDTIEPPAEQVRKPHSWSNSECAHNRVRLDEAAHQLKCSDCDQVLDAFDWIWDYVGKWARENTGYRQAKQQRQQAEKELVELERKVKNRRAAVRRPGVLLTSGDARRLRDQFYLLARLVRYLTESHEDALRTAHLHGYDPAATQGAFHRLAAAVEMRDEPAEEAAG